MSETVKAAPVSSADRIQVLDILRGFAVLGILIMNIQSYSMIEAAYMNPTAYGDLSGLNRWVWMLSHIIANEKFITLFSVMFGAGIALFTGKLDDRGTGSAGVHYRRSLILLLFGLIHAYVFWSGDVLVWYSLCALIVYLFRRMKPKKLLIIGMIGFAIPSLLFLFFGGTMQFWPEEAAQNMSRDWWAPSADVVQKEIAAYQGGVMDQMEYRVHDSIGMHTFIFLIWGFWRSAGLMLIGMALYKTGVIAAARSKKFYLILMAIGFSVGLPLILIGLAENFAADWAIELSMFFGSVYNYWGSIFMAAAYMSIIMLLFGAGRLPKAGRVFAAVGRMAFTNYLTQTLICTTIFYGNGFGLFGRVERTGQILIVFAVWAVQLIWSSLWLKHFNFGPFEWAWRSLTYMKPQPFKAKKP